MTQINHPTGGFFGDQFLGPFHFSFPAYRSDRKFLTSPGRGGEGVSVVTAQVLLAVLQGAAAQGLRLLEMLKSDPRIA